MHYLLRLSELGQLPHTTSAVQARKNVASNFVQKQVNQAADPVKLTRLDRGLQCMAYTDTLLRDDPILFH